MTPPSKISIAILKNRPVIMQLKLVVVIPVAADSQL